MKNYYVVPLQDDLILLSYRIGKYISISEYVRQYFPEMAELEEERISIIYSGNYNMSFTRKQQIQLEINRRKKIQMARNLGIPLNLLVEENEGKTYEIVTHKKVISKDSEPSFLAIREKPKNIFLTYYNSDYIVKVKNLMRKGSLRNDDFQVIQGGLQKVIKR